MSIILKYHSCNLPYNPVSNPIQKQEKTNLIQFMQHNSPTRKQSKMLGKLHFLRWIVKKQLENKHKIGSTSALCILISNES